MNDNPKKSKIQLRREARIADEAERLKVCEQFAHSLGPGWRASEPSNLCAQHGRIVVQFQTGRSASFRASIEQPKFRTLELPGERALLTDGYAPSARAALENAIEGTLREIEALNRGVHLARRALNALQEPV